MLSRSVLRSQRASLRPSALPSRTRNARFQSTSSSPSSNNHLMAGVAGGVAAGVTIYGVWYLTPSGRASRKFNKTAYEAQKYYNDTTKKIQESTPNTDQAIEYVKNFAYSYVAWIPGGRGMVDKAFQDLEIIRKNHGPEVDSLVKESYGELQQISKSGLSMESAHKAFEVLDDFSRQLAALAGDAVTDILDNHPQLKEKYGQSFTRLKQMGDSMGPDMKKQVDETWTQVQDVLKGGFSMETMNKARKLVEDKTQELGKLGDQAWKKAMDQAKPYLEKNPKLKELVEKNAGALKQGNVSELFVMVKRSADSGSTGNVEDYVDEAVNKAKQSTGMRGGSSGDIMSMIPGAGEIMPKLTSLYQAAQTHRKEGESLLKETMQELEKVLSKQSEKAKKLADKAQSEAQ